MSWVSDLHRLHVLGSSICTGAGRQPGQSHHHNVAAPNATSWRGIPSYTIQSQLACPQKPAPCCGSTVASNPKCLPVGSQAGSVPAVR